MELRLPRIRARRLVVVGAIVAAAVALILADPGGVLASSTDCIAGACPDDNLFNINGTLDLKGVENKIKALATWFFGIGTIYFIAMVWKNGLAMARSGDNPQARAQAQAALWANAAGGVIFFGAALFASILNKFVSN